MCTDCVKLLNERLAKQQLATIRQAIQAKTRVETAEIHSLNELNRLIHKTEKDNPPLANLLKRKRAAREYQFFGA